VSDFIRCDKCGHDTTELASAGWLRVEPKTRAD
jgi:hypothetical protein